MALRGAVRRFFGFALPLAQVIAHHNATLTNISRFGSRVRTMAAATFNP